MGEMWIKLPSGTELPFMQAVELARLIKKAEPGSTHWHQNDCGCCVSLHGPDCAWVIGPDGDSTFYADRGCGCGNAEGGG
jgi:hypothetical protein